MKRILALVLSLAMLIVCFSSFSVSANNEKQLFFELSSNGESTIVVDAGEEFTVDFYAQNMTDGEIFGITALENQIEYKHEFFEYVSADLESGPAYRATDSGCSWDRTIRWLEIMSAHYPQPAGYKNRQLVMTVTFKVKDGIAEGSSGVLSSKACYAAYGEAEHTISTKDLTVYVGKIPETTYTLTYISEGNVVNTAGDLAMGAETKLYGLPSAAQDKKFGGWVDENGKVWEENAPYTVSGDMTFNAKWYSKYTLTFETDGGSSISPLEFYEDYEINVSNFAATTKDGFVFDGWFEDAETTIPVATTFKLTSDKTIYAKWIEAAPQTYTLTFETNGGNSIASVTKNKDSVVSLSEYTPTRTGYNFKGWYSDKDLKNKVTSITLDANKTVYADWEKKDSGGGGNSGGGGGGSTVTNYTITLKNPDDTVLGTSVQKSNTNVDLSQFKFTKEGYVLEGWYTNKELSEKVTSLKLTADTILYANWVKDGSPTPSRPGYHPEMLTTEHYAYVMGGDGGLICPLENITRAEVATIFFRLLTNETRKAYITNENTFNDVSSDAWYNTEVSTLANLGIVKGRAQDTFDPNAYITRAEFTTIAARFSDGAYSGEDFFTDIDGHWAQEYINTAANLGWVVGDNGIFRPDDNITRAEVMTLVNRVLNRQPESVDDMLEGMIEYPDNMDKDAWYYLAVQEAANSHEAEMKFDGIHEKWTALTENPDWEAMEKLN